MKNVLSKAVLGAASATAVGVLAFGGVASAAATTINAAGSGQVNPSNPYDAGVTATWSSTTVSGNGGWNKIVNATITTIGGYGWHQTYTLTEKQKNAGDPFSVSGTVTLWTEYGSYTGAIAPLTVSGVDLPFSSPVPGTVVTENSSPVGAALLNADINIVYNIQPAGVNADYWFGY